MLAHTVKKDRKAAANPRFGQYRAPPRTGQGIRA